MDSITSFSFLDFLHLASLQKSDIVYIVRNENKIGKVVLKKGEIIHASLDGPEPLSGQEAFLAIASWKSVDEIETAELQSEYYRNLMMSTSALLETIANTSNFQNTSNIPSNRQILGSSKKAQKNQKTSPSDGNVQGAYLSQKRSATPVRLSPIDEAVAAEPQDDKPRGRTVVAYNQFQEIATQMKAQLPGALATGVFNIKDGLVMAVDSNVPDTNIDHMSIFHSTLWDRTSEFLTLLPSEIVGELKSMILEVEGFSFFICVDRGYQVAVMAACDTSTGNLGLLRIITKRYLNKTLLALSNI